MVIRDLVLYGHLRAKRIEKSPKMNLTDLMLWMRKKNALNLRVFSLCRRCFVSRGCAAKVRKPVLKRIGRRRSFNEALGGALTGGDISITFFALYYCHSRSECRKFAPK